MKFLQKSIIISLRKNKNEIKFQTKGEAMILKNAKMVLFNRMFQGDLRIEGSSITNIEENLIPNTKEEVFNLQGNIHDLQILLEAGLGFRRSEGFGLIDLI